MSELNDQRQTWTCRIGVTGSVAIPNDGDSPMRDAIFAAFRRVTGQDAEHCFSGWGDTWDDGELAVIEKRDAIFAAFREATDQGKQVPNAVFAAAGYVDPAKWDQSWPPASGVGSVHRPGIDPVGDELDFGAQAAACERAILTQPGEVVAWLRHLPSGAPDWSEDCVADDNYFLDEDLRAEGYTLRALIYEENPPVKCSPSDERVARAMYERIVYAGENFQEVLTDYADTRDAGGEVNKRLLDALEGLLTVMCAALRAPSGGYYVAMQGRDGQMIDTTISIEKAKAAIDAAIAQDKGEQQ